ncbi:MAG: hypothetical protein ACLQHS_10290 [Candidatus Limnocylindrales bacterium]
MSVVAYALAVEAVGMDHVATLRVVVPARLDLARVTAVLGQPHIPWLGERLAGSEGPMRRYISDLEFHVPDLGPVAFRKSAVISLGSVTRDGLGWIVPVEWQAATLAPLFPVFVGTLRLWADRAVLDGRYAPRADGSARRRMHSCWGSLPGARPAGSSAGSLIAWRLMLRVARRRMSWSRAAPGFASGPELPAGAGIATLHKA